MQAEASAHVPALEAHWGGGAAPFGATWQKTMMWIFIVTDGLLFSGLLSGYGFLRMAVMIRMTSPEKTWEPWKPVSTKKAWVNWGGPQGFPVRRAPS